MANSMLPIVGLLIIGGVGYYYYNEEETLTDTTTSQTPQSGGVPTTSNGSGGTNGSTTTTTTQDNKNYVDEWINPTLYNRRSDFKKFMAGDVDDIHQPFSVHRLMGWHRWINNSKVKLEDSDWRTTSGGIDIQIAEGFKVKLRIKTENRNYFHNDVYVDADNDKDSAKKWINNNTDGSASDEIIEVFFGPGDRLEIDIDNEHSGAYVFGIKKDGTWLRGEVRPDDEFYITMTDIKIRNPDYDPDRFATEFNAIGGLRGIRGLWGAIKGSRIGVRIGSGLSNVRGVITGSKVGGKIPEGTKAVGVVDDGMAAKDIEKLEGVRRLTDNKDKLRLKEGYKLVDKNGIEVVKDGAGFYRIGKNQRIVKSIDGASDLSTGKSIFTRKNALNAALGTVGIAVVGGLVNFFGFILPETLGEGLENLLASCEDKCAESTDPDCIEKCQEDKQETFTKIGLAVVGTILGLTLILKRPSSSKEAEEIYLVRG